MRGTILVAWLSFALVSSAQAQSGPADPAPAQDSILITGKAVRESAPAEAGKRIWVLQIDAKRGVLRALSISKSGVVALSSPSGVIDNDGKFAITLRRDYVLEGKKKGEGKVALALDAAPGPNFVVVEITGAKSVYETEVAVAIGTRVGNASEIAPGASFDWDGRTLTAEKVGKSTGFKFDAPGHPKAQGAAIDLTSIIVNADGCVSWNTVTTTVQNGKAVQWEAVVENGWVEGYRILNADLAVLQGQQIAIPSAMGDFFLGTVDGDRVIAGQGIGRPSRTMW